MRRPLLFVCLCLSCSSVPADESPSSQGSSGSSPTGDDDAAATTAFAPPGSSGTVDLDTTGGSAPSTTDATTDDGGHSQPVGDCEDLVGMFTPNEQAIVDLPADSWTTLPDTRFLPVCEATQKPWQVAVEGCGAVIHSWSGGVWTGRHLLVWGGGHSAYYGNEVYGFDVATASWTALSEPTDVMVFGSDPLSDGQPNSRHTYNHLAWIDHRGEMLGYGGATSPDGWNSRRTWTFDEQNATWTQRGDLPELTQTYWGASAYDPMTQRVYIQDERAVRSYDPESGEWTTMLDEGYSGYKIAVVVPDARLFFAVGREYDGGEARALVMDIDAGTDVSDAWTEVLEGFTDAQGGADVDLATGEIVTWSGGSPRAFDLAAKSWTTLSATGAPAEQNAGIDPSNRNGTWGRFRYMPQYNAFILVDDEESDVYIYKHTAGCG